MKKIFFFAVIGFCLFAAGKLYGENLGAKILVRLNYEDFPRLSQLGLRGLDVAGARPGEWIDLVVNKDLLDRIKVHGIEAQIMLPDLEAYEQSVAWTYHSYPSMVSMLQSIANTYPAIAQLYDLGAVYQGNHIYALKISDDVSNEDPNEPDVLFFGEHHAREWPSMEIPLFYCDTLTKAYGFNATITNLVNSREIWIIPTVNPDGHVYSHDQGHDWRKNRHYFSEFNTWGVDLNRNYDGAVNGDKDGAWGDIPGYATTHYPNQETYCGPGPISELETQKLRDLFKVHDFVISCSYHTYSELVMWSWGYDYSQTPDNTLLVQIGTNMASRITRQGGSGTYTPQQCSFLYPTSGSSEDWLYGYPLYVGGKNCLTYIVEACNTFQPQQNALDQILRENFDGALYLLDMADDAANSLIPRVMPPAISPMGSDPDGDYTVSWTQINPEANPDYYELQELAGLSRITEGAEAGSALWNLEGFVVTSSRYHSGTRSFYSNLNTGNGVTTMTLKNPFPIYTGDSLAFWCYYNIEYRWDYAYVEISVDGREWKILADFTGNSGGWLRKVYSLSSYAGKSLFVRFRYITDDATENEGFYVDDIYPIGSFSLITTLATNIPGTSYDIIGQDPGTYWYQVKGHNASRGWADFGILEDITVSPVVSLVLNRTSPDPHHRGGNLTYDALFTNNTGLTQQVYYWAVATLPIGRNREVLAPELITVAVPSYTRGYVQTIPMNAPYGDYVYTGYISTTPHGPVMSQSSFTLTIQAQE